MNTSLRRALAPALHVSTWLLTSSARRGKIVRFLRDAVITLAVLALVVWLVAVARVRSGGLSADAQPGRIEQVVARNLVRLSIPAAAKRTENPFRDDPEAWRTAAAHYEDHCAACHGPDGRAQTVMASGLYPKVPDLTQPLVQRLTDGELFYVIQNGVRWTGMPAWRLQHSEEDSWRLVTFVRRLPTLTAEDLDSLNHMFEHPDAVHHHHGHDHPDDH
jgi:mono/diheme cytochrome c family protein